VRREESEVSEGLKPDDSAAVGSKSVWNTLELAKLIVGALTPALLFWYGQQLVSEREQAAEGKEKYVQVVKKRVELWEKLAGNLNDVYCYFLYIGHWKALSAQEVVAKKREMDKLIYANRPFFSDDFFAHYDAYMKATFRTFGGWGKDAALRTRAIRPKDEGVDPTSFTDEDNSKEVHERYFALLKYAATELNIAIPNAGAGTPPRTPQSKQELEPPR